MQVRHNITLDEDVSKELESVAEELGEKKSAIIEKALETYFDLLDLKLAKKRLADLEKRLQILESKMAENPARETASLNFDCASSIG